MDIIIKTTHSQHVSECLRYAQPARGAHRPTGFAATGGAGDAVAAVSGAGHPGGSRPGDDARQRGSAGKSGGRNEYGRRQHGAHIHAQLVPPTRIERVTLPLGGGCSIH